MKRLLTRRRVLLALVALALLAGGAAWWYFSPRLSSEEKQLVGKWSAPLVQLNTKQPPFPPGTRQVYEFRPDRVVRIAHFNSDGTQKGKTAVGRWSVENGELVVEPRFPDDGGLSSLLERRPDVRNRHALRSVTPDQIVFDYDPKVRQLFGVNDPITLTRDPAAPTPSDDVYTLRELSTPR